MSAPSESSSRGSRQQADKTEEVEAPLGPVTFTRRKSKVSKGEGLWLMSFSDMSLILMSFFVLQLSFSTPDKRKYDNLNSAITKSASPAKAAPDNLQVMSDKLRKVIKAKNLEKVAEVTYAVDGLRLEFKDATLFSPGSAAPNPAYAKVVDEVMATVAKAPGNYKLVFEGHTDDTPVYSRKFHSNWDLASARSVALLDSFKARGVAEQRMSVTAFAHTRPKVKIAGLKGDALKKARAANRRVVIRLE